jgi:uncharacterized LabA/DUF88 family protein
VTTYVYVDGLNFYFGAVKKTPNKWVDFEAVARKLVPKDKIGLIRYFTANVKPQYPGDKSHERQQALLRAMKANPLIDVKLGHFRVDEKWRPLSDTSWPSPKDLFRPVLRPTIVVKVILAEARKRRTIPVTMARILDPEEKGSDVNLATYLLYDAMKGLSTKALVISNDSDLEEAVRLTVEHGVPVGIVNPHPSPTSGRLKSVATFEIPFRKAMVASCQMPTLVIGRNGKQVHKPREW